MKDTKYLWNEQSDDDIGILKHCRSKRIARK